MPRLKDEDLAKVDGWLQKLLWDSVFPGGTEPVEVHRLKARLVFENGEVRMVQGVREVFDILNPLEKTTRSSDDLHGKVIIIGRGIRGLDFEKSLRCTLEC